jgi:hypothetical protein
MGRPLGLSIENNFDKTDSTTNKSQKLLQKKQMTHVPTLHIEKIIKPK